MSRPLETSTPGMPGLAALGAGAVAVLEHEACDARPLGESGGGIDRRKRKPAGRANQHIATGHSIAVMLRLLPSPIRVASQGTAHA